MSEATPNDAPQTVSIGGKERPLPELGGEQMIQILARAARALERVGDIGGLITEEQARYYADKRVGYVQRSHVESLDEAEREEFLKSLDAGLADWAYWEDLSDEVKQRLADGPGITEADFDDGPIVVAEPSGVPMWEMVTRLFPRIYEAAYEEVAEMCAIALMDSGELKQAVKKRYVEQFILDQRAELFEVLKPREILPLAAAVVGVALKELLDGGGEAGNALTPLASALGLKPSENSAPESEAGQESQSSEQQSSMTSVASTED